MTFEGVHCPGCKVDLSPAALGFGFTEGMAASLPHQGTPYAQRLALQVYVFPAESQELTPPQSRGDRQNVQGLKAVAGRFGSL